MGLTENPEVSYEEPSINEKEGLSQEENAGEVPVVVLKGRERNTSDFGTAINILKSYLGSGILGLPYAFREGGVSGSLFIMVFIGIISSHAMYLLVKTKQALNKKDVPVVSFGDIAEHCYGKIGLYLVNGMLMFTQFGFCCVYVVYVSSNLQDLLQPSMSFSFFPFPFSFSSLLSSPSPSLYSPLPSPSPPPPLLPILLSFSSLSFPSPSLQSASPLYSHLSPFSFCPFCSTVPIPSSIPPFHPP